MADSGAPASEWGRYLRRITSAPGWSVARLARESGIHRATIFEWIRGDGESVTIGSVRAVAAASGDDLQNALRAAANLAPATVPSGGQPDEADEETELIRSAPLGQDVKRRMLARLAELREQHRRQRLRILEWMVTQEVEFHRGCEHSCAPDRQPGPAAAEPPRAGVTRPGRMANVVAEARGFEPRMGVSPNRISSAAP